MNRVTTPILVLWLAALWVLLWGDLTLENAVAGLGIAVIVVLIAHPTGTRFTAPTNLHPLAALRYVGYFAVQLVKSNLTVAWEVVSPGSKIVRAIVSIPMHTTSPGINTLVANSVTLTPGTIVVDVREHGDDRPPTLYVHALHFDDVEAIRRDVLRLEQYAVAAFGTAEHRAALDAARLDSDRRAQELSS